LENEAWRKDDAERDAAKADEIVARALQEKVAPPPVSISPEARSFGHRKAS
jgi:hypothetical protein